MHASQPRHSRSKPRSARLAQQKKFNSWCLCCVASGFARVYRAVCGRRARTAAGHICRWLRTSMRVAWDRLLIFGCKFKFFR